MARKTRDDLLRELSRASARDAVPCLAGWDLRGADLSGLNLHGVNLESSILRCTNLAGTDLSNANITSSDLIKAHLTGADLRGADLTDSSLGCADLTGADLTGANLACAALRHATLYPGQLLDTQGLPHSLSDDVWDHVLPEDPAARELLGELLRDWDGTLGEAIATAESLRTA